MVPHLWLVVSAGGTIGAKLLSEPMLEYCKLKPSVKVDYKIELFIDENAFENIVCEMAAIFFSGGMGWIMSRVLIVS